MKTKINELVVLLLAATMASWGTGCAKKLPTETTTDDDAAEATADDDEVAVTLTVTGSPYAEDPETSERIGSFRTFAGSPASLTFHVFAFYISENTDCSDPILVEDYGEEGVEIDFYDEPELFTGSPADGTYPCIMLKAYDFLKGTPDAVAAEAFPGVCDDSVEISGDLYREGETPYWVDEEGVGVPPTGTSEDPGNDLIVFFASTVPEDAVNGPLATSTNQTMLLSAPLVVPGEVIFYADFNDGWTGDDENDDPPRCKLDGGTGLGFR